MSARFRHVALHRLELKTGQPGARIHTACWPVGRQWRCAAVAFDEWGLVQNVGRFRFTRTRSSTGYSGPRGKRWIMTIPRHWSGHIYFWSIGQPMDPAPQ
jgi:hypothetical protein